MITNTENHNAKKYDVFISHASEDKIDFIRPLAKELKRLGLKVWLDEEVLILGDSIRQVIEMGLLSSRYGVVVISPYFLRKDMPQKELDALISLESDSQKVILPIWHNISLDEMKKSLPLLVGKWAAHSSDGVESVAKQILKAVNKACPHCGEGPIFINHSAGEAGCRKCKKSWLI